MAKDIMRWMQDTPVTCSECGAAGEVDSRFNEWAGDERLNFYKVYGHGQGTCGHCGNEMELDVRYWRREFYIKNTKGEEVCHECALWGKDNSPGCNADSVFNEYESSGEMHADNVSLGLDDALELVGLLYGETKDPELTAIEETLRGKEEEYRKMPSGSEEEKARREQFETESVESVIPQLKKIIESHDDVLKDPYDKPLW